MLSDSISQKAVPSPVRRTGMNYPDSVKIEAVKLWLVTGNLRHVSAGLNIPYDTIRTWRAAKWWDTLVTDMRTEGTIALSNRTRKIAERAMEITLDRLDNGDWFYDQKTGKLTRKPVAMRDAHQVAISFMDRTLKLDDKPAAQEQQATINDRLAQLADAFSKMAGKTRQIEVIDVPYQECLPEPLECPTIDDLVLEDTQVAKENENAFSEEWSTPVRPGSSVGEDQEASKAEGSRTENPSEEIGRENDREPTL